MSQAFAGGAASRDTNAQLLGLNSTDELYFAADVIFTASHNPTEYNGMKMTRAGAVAVPSDTNLIENRDLA